jgi:hypothetical protein
MVPSLSPLKNGKAGKNNDMDLKIMQDISALKSTVLGIFSLPAKRSQSRSSLE